MKWNDFNEDWLRPGSVVEVTVPNLGACLREIGRLRQLHKSGGDLATLRSEVEAIIEKLEDGFEYDEEAKKFFAVWTEREINEMRAQARRVYENLPQPHKPDCSERPKWAEGCGQYPHCPCNETRNCTEREER